MSVAVAIKRNGLLCRRISVCCPLSSKSRAEEAPPIIPQSLISPSKKIQFGSKSQNWDSSRHRYCWLLLSFFSFIWLSSFPCRSSTAGCTIITINIYMCNIVREGKKHAQVQDRPHNASSTDSRDDTSKTSTGLGWIAIPRFGEFWSCYCVPLAWTCLRQSRNMEIAF